MFSLGNYISQEIKNLRQELKLTKTELAKLSGISIKAIYQLETKKRKGKIETFIKIKNAIKENFNVDLFEKIGVKIVWKLEDLDQKGLNIIEGGLLGDGCIAKYGVYIQEAKDKKYLEWLAELLNESGIKCKIVATKSKSSYSKSKEPFYRLYTYSCPAFFELRKRWYINILTAGKEIKRVPIDVKLTPTTLLHWYLGDGNFKRDDRKFPKGGRPSLRLFVNDFLKEDIELLLKKLKDDLNLNFYTSPKLNKNIGKGYVFYLYPFDLFNFFKIMGFGPPKEIKDCVTEERKGEIHTFKEKWPNEYDWIKILAKTRRVGELLKAKRKGLGFTQRELAGKVGVKKHHISEIECGRKRMSLQCFTKILDTLKLDINQILLTISNGKAGEIVAERMGEGLLASELIKVIPEVIKY